MEYDRKLGLEKGSSLVTNDGEGTRGAWYIFVSVISTWKLLYVFFFFISFLQDDILAKLARTSWAVDKTKT